MLKLTPEVKKALESLKGSFVAMASLENGIVWQVKDIKLAYVMDWTIQTIPPKKGLFGHKGYEEVVEISVKFADDYGTTWYSSYKNNLNIVLEGLLRARNNFLLLTKDIEKFGFTVNKKEQ